MAATLVLRTVKGTPLTNYEVDNNFSNLNTFGDVVSSNIGVLTSLTTTNKGNIVFAVNEIQSNVGVVTGLVTTATTNLVSAVNSVKLDQGNILQLTTLSTSNIVSAINELKANVTTADAATGVTAATYGNSTNIPVITISTTGKITSASNVAIVTGTSLTNDTSTDNTYYIPFTVSTSGSINTANVSSSKLFFNPSTGLLTSTDYNSSSDETLKDNIQPITDALATIKQLSGKTFNWKDNGKKSFGLIAQDVEKIIPEIVNETDGIKGINYINIIAFLIEAVKDLSEQVEQLKQ